jgi:hypothetical protein
VATTGTAIECRTNGDAEPASIGSLRKKTAADRFEKVDSQRPFRKMPPCTPEGIGQNRGRRCVV